jgi:ABC-type histidine transport system ATPase subunit
MSETAIQFAGVTKRYGTLEVLRGLSIPLIL